VLINLISLFFVGKLFWTADCGLQIYLGLRDAAVQLEQYQSVSNFVKNNLLSIALTNGYKCSKRVLKTLGGS